MTTLPISAADLYRFNPLKDRIEKARESLEDAERAVDEAELEAGKAPDDADKKAKVKEARDLVKVLENILANQERELKKAKVQPEYLLKVPTYRTQTALEELAAMIPPSPSDRKMFAAIKAAGLETGLIPEDDPDLKEVAKALRETGGGVPKEKRGLFDDLHERVCDHPTVRGVVAARHRYAKALDLLTVRFYLKGVDGLPGAEAFRIEHDLVTEESTDIIPPDDLSAIEAKVAELRSVRGREGNSSSSPSPSRSSGKRTKTE